MNYQIGLTTLPHELQLLITSYLTTPEKQLLRATCAHFRNFLPPTTRLCLFDITFSIYNHKAYTPCYTCMILTPSSEWYLAPPNPYHKCRVCGNDSYLYTDAFESSELDEERKELRTLREQQGLGKAFWDQRGTRDL